MNEIIATGHVMRCLAVADAARAQGEETVFILADEQAVTLLEERGYPYIVLHTQWDAMEQELPELCRVLVEQKIKTLLIDSYQVTQKYLEQLAMLVHTVYIDDLNTFIYPVNALICYASYWKKFAYMEHYKDTKLFLGTQYTPLRNEFCNCGKKNIKSEIEHLLLLSGGTDAYDILSRLLEMVDKKKYKQIDVICGRYYPDYDVLAEKYGRYENIHLHKSVNNIKDYMQEADLVITAGGITLYELCACGTPTISYALADNQLDNVRQFQQDGVIMYAGDVRYVDITEKILDCLKQYESAELRREHSRKMQQIVDGRGAERIVDILHSL